MSMLAAHRKNERVQTRKIATFNINGIGNWTPPFGLILQRRGKPPPLKCVGVWASNTPTRRSKMENYHIIKTDNGWALTKQGAERASKTAATKAEITALASEFLNGKTASLKIHKEDGTIQEERTYPRSADPTATKG